MLQAKLIPIKKALEKMGIKFEDVRVLELVNGVWRCLQAGKSEVEIHLIDNQIKLVKPL